MTDHREDGRFYVSEFDRLLAKESDQHTATTPPPSPIVVTLAVGAAVVGWAIYLIMTWGR